MLSSEQNYSGDNQACAKTSVYQIPGDELGQWRGCKIAANQFLIVL